MPPCSPPQRRGLQACERAASFACRPALTASARDGRGDPRWGRGKPAARSNRGSTQKRGAALRRSAWIAEEIELAGIRGGHGRDCLVMAADLDVVVVLEVESELHERGGDIGGGLVGYGELVLLLSAVFASCHGVLTRRFLFSAEALAFDDDGIDVVQDAVEDGGGEGAVVIEDLSPVFVDAVGGDHQRRALVALADNLEQQVGTVFVDRQVAELVDDKQAGLEVAADLPLEAAGGLRGGERIDDVDGGGEERGVAADAGGMAECYADIRLAEANGRDQDDVGIRSDEGQAEQVSGS